MAAQAVGMDERDWIARARSGDRAAYEPLYRAHVGRVYGLCLRMVRGDVPRAEDLTQEVFVRAWRKLDTFRGESAFSTWLHRLASNLVLTELRSHSRRHSREYTTGDLAAVEPARRESTAGLKMDLERAIAGLPERARQVFVLHDVEGYRHKEVAAMMGLATGTTKAQLHRARRLLREVLA